MGMGLCGVPGGLYDGHSKFVCHGVAQAMVAGGSYEQVCVN